ncbi:MAG: TlpA family protein disulfide reductase [Solirubrobacterales bacterium]
MPPLGVGEPAPPVSGVAFGDGPVGLFFFKVTCPTCQLAAPKMAAFERAYPGRVVGIGQDPQDVLETFGEFHGMGIRALEDRPPYEVSNAYGIVSVPTLIVVGDDGTVIESVGAWDREGFNRASERIASALGVDPAAISVEGDGLPSFKPG